MPYDVHPRRLIPADRSETSVASDSEFTQPPDELQPRWRVDRQEISGACGDLGTFIPLLVGMVNSCGLQLGPALLLAGVMNVITGLAFGIPMPVQPMKAIAAVAIAEGLNESTILTAGIVTSAVILTLGVTGMIDWLNRAIPKSVVRGLQLAIGFKLLVSGIGMIAGTPPLIGWDSIALGVACAAFVLVVSTSNRIPAALVVFAVGIAALVVGPASDLAGLHFGMTWRLPDLGGADDWLTGLWRGALPQIPLTTLNSVIAVCALSADLFPRRPASPRKVAVSVALMNLLACPFGAMPLCHGAGGLAGQYRFGARTGASVVMLGAAKMALALILGDCLLAWIAAYPASVLGVLLLFSGLELAGVCRDQTKKSDFLLMILTAGACMAVNTATGFVAGWAVAVLLIRGVFRNAPPDEKSA
jgi:hypothetical protein